MGSQSFRRGSAMLRDRRVSLPPVLQIADSSSLRYASVKRL